MLDPRAFRAYLMFALLDLRAYRAYLMFALLDLRAYRACQSRDSLVRLPSNSSNMCVTMRSRIIDIDSLLVNSYVTSQAKNS